MTLSDRRLMVHIASLVRTLTSDEVERLCHALLSGSVQLGSGGLAIQYACKLPTNQLPTITSLFISWAAAGGNARELAVGLAAASTAYRGSEAEQPRVQLAWTGPNTATTHARTTLGALLDVIDSANHDVIIVGYSITQGATQVFERLAAAQHRGARVTLIGNRIEHRLSILQSLWPVARLPTLYTRRADPQDPMSALHAKLAIVDGKRLLVTSANLTYHGLVGNIEVGVIVEGPVAHDVLLLIQDLIARGVLEQVT